MMILCFYFRKKETGVTDTFPLLYFSYYCRCHFECSTKRRKASHLHQMDEVCVGEKLSANEASKKITILEE